MVAVGPPTSAALRVAGQWPTPENMVDRLIEAFEAAANDDSLDEATRTRAQKIWDGLKSGGSKIAIGALAGAGGHFLSGHRTNRGVRNGVSGRSRTQWSMAKFGFILSVCAVTVSAMKLAANEDRWTDLQAHTGTHAKSAPWSVLLAVAALVGDEGIAGSWTAYQPNEPEGRTTWTDWVATAERLICASGVRRADVRLKRRQ